MTDTDKAYIAGIIDGEGSIMLIRHKPNQHPSPTISVTSSTIELLDHLHKTIKSGTIKSKKNYNPSKHKANFTYELRGDKAIYLLKEIFPYLVINTKRERASHITLHYKQVTKRNGRYNNEELELKQKFYDDFMAL